MKKEPDNTLYCYEPEDLTRKDFLTLREGKYVNDVIINFSMKNIFLSQEASKQEKTHMFTTFFYHRLADVGKSEALSKSSDTLGEKKHRNVQTWTKNVDIFKKDFVLIPINVKDRHWYLAIICYPGLLAPRKTRNFVQRPVILFLDSLEDNKKDEVAKTLREYLACEWKEKMKHKDEIRTFQAAEMPYYCPQIPQQHNFTDCGLYLLEYVESFFQSPINDFSVPLPSKWFNQESVRHKRASIAHIVKTMSEEQNPQQTFQFPVIANVPLEVSEEEDTEHLSISSFVKGYSPNYNTGFICKPRGINNRSNWCFAISSLQALMACPPLHNHLLELATSNVQIPLWCKFLNAMVDFTSNLVQTKSGVVDPSCILRVLLGIPQRIFMEGRQEDAEECLNFILNNLSEEMKKLKNENKIELPNHIQVE